MHIVLVSTGRDWVSAARLPRALKAAGFTVTVCAPADSLIAKGRFVDRRAELRPPVSTQGIWTALRELRRRWGPAFVMPCDEAAVHQLHHVAGECSAAPDEEARAVGAALVASLGTPEHFDDSRRRSHFAAAAALPGCVIPTQCVVRPGDDVFAAAARIGYPVAVKRDGTAGGLGVHRVDDAGALATLVDADATFQALAPGRATVREGETVVVQAWVDGTPASVSLAALGGRTLAAFAYGRREGQGTGPTTVAEAIERPDLVAAARLVVARFGFSGFGGVDFLLPRGTGRPHLLEFNARPTVTSHLGPVLGADLCAALYAALAGAPPPEDTPPRAKRVALFPGEWLRDPASPHLHGALHDVPWDDPPLLRAILLREPV